MFSIRVVPAASKQKSDDECIRNAHPPHVAGTRRHHHERLRFDLTTLPVAVRAVIGMTLLGQLHDALRRPCAEQPLTFAVSQASRNQLPKPAALKGCPEPCKECQSPCANHRHAWRRGVSRSSGWVRPSRSEAMRTRSVFPVPKGWALRRRDFLLLSAAEAPTRRARLGPRKGEPQTNSGPRGAPWSRFAAYGPVQ